MRSKVYFIPEVSSGAMLRLYDTLGVRLEGKVAVKLHSGEPGNQNFLRPDFMKPMVDKVGGVIVECNTAYDGGRNTTKAHKITMERHGWTSIAPVDLLDETDDMELAIPNGKVIQKNFVGAHLADYDSLLVLSHFKGHPMGGFGGALKQLSIGFASSAGKCWIHSGGKVTDQSILWENCAEQLAFCEAMADAAASVASYFKGNAAYVNMVCNLSVDCDCGAAAEDPCMKDIGILSSLVPVALDQACLDLIYQSDDPGRDHFIERVESRKGVHTIDAAAALGLGCKEYELVSLD